MNFFCTKPAFRPILTIISLIMLFSPALRGQDGSGDDKKIPTPEESAATEAERLGNLLKLEDWQIFYVDSTLQHDYVALKNELEQLKLSKVENYDLYVKVQDKWMDRIDNSYKKFFNDKQWAAYLKSGAGKAQKAREKRKIKMAKSENNR